MEEVGVTEVVSSIAANSLEALMGILIKLGLSLLVFVIAKLVISLIRRFFNKVSNKEPAKLTPLMAGFVVKVLAVVVGLFAVLIILQIWGINLAPVIAGLGITGVVLGFALQESISNVFSGLLLALNNPFQLGDYVIIGSVEGTVTAMDGISVTLLTGDRKKVTIANKLVLEDPVINFSSSDTRRLDMTVSVAYGSDLERTRQIIRETISAYPEILQEPVPVIEVSKLNSSSVDFIVRPWVRNEDYWKVNWRFQKDIYDRLNEEGITIPFNTLTVNVSQDNG